MNELDTLRPEVRAAMEAMDADMQTLGWLCIRAELLRLQSTESRANEWQLRAEKAEAELAALKARIFHGLVLDVDDLARGHAGLPSEWRGKRVRLVVED